MGIFSFHFVCVFITIAGTLKIYLRVFDKNRCFELRRVFACRCTWYKKISAIRSTEIHSRKKSVGKPHIHHFYDLQLQLSFSNYLLRVINYCAFRSQNDSNSLLILNQRSEYLNAELLKNVSTINIIRCDSF